MTTNVMVSREALQELSGYVQHLHGCDHVANGIDGDCQCGLYAMRDRFRAILAEQPQANPGPFTSVDACAEVCARAKLCAICQGELEASNALNGGQQPKPNVHEPYCNVLHPAAGDLPCDCRISSLGLDFKDAYEGAREDLAIWKKRALAAEEKVRVYDQRIVDLGVLGMRTAVEKGSAAQSALDEREAFNTEYDAIGPRHTSTNREIALRMFRAGAAWQRAQSAPAGAMSKLLDWAVERWHAEVSERPLENVHRRSLDDTWRQIIRRLGGDTGLLCGPAHDELLVVKDSSK